MDEIIKLRDQIDNLDKELLGLIAQRIDLVRSIGEEKKKSGINIIDPDREQEIYKKLTAMAQEKGIDPETIKKIWGVLIKISYEIEGAENANS